MCDFPRRAQKTVKVFGFAALLMNIVTAISVICILTKRHIALPESMKHKMLDYKHLLDNAYKHVQSKSVKTGDQTGGSSSLEFLSLLKPVSNLSGMDFDKTEKVQKSKTIRNWTLSEGSERTLMYNEMTFENGSIVIPAAGLYIVYSHAKFYVEDNVKNGEQSLFYHELLRYNALNMTQKLLLSNRVTECKEGINDGAHLEYPSDIHGVVRLNAGDMLTVKVSGSSPLKHDRDWHYFGAYLV